MDEKPYQLLAHVRDPIPAGPGRDLKEDWRVRAARDLLDLLLGRTPGQRLLLLAGGPLSSLPFAAINSTEGRLVDHVEVRSLVGVRGRPLQVKASKLPQAVGVANPTGALRFASSELTSMERYLPTVVPPPGVGLRNWLLAHAPEASHLHLAFHAEPNVVDPFNSRFVLGQNLGLTVGDLAQANLGSLDLVVATACKSGVVDARTSDEQVGLAPALTSPPGRPEPQHDLHDRESVGERARASRATVRRCCHLDRR
ncbi:CHAT domain-containing protein [Rhodococcus sp. T2V]|uniref:CHAT domain-containing protein n=1 Tax=Rhodococcus sp. T2V TaxID=3034164 RepID=UPI0034E2773E